MFGFGVAQCNDGGTCACFNASTVLINPHTPAAESKCPTFDFTDPIAQDAAGNLCDENASDSAAISIGSPSGVAVPCASTYPILSRLTSAIANASEIARACP